ncbi:hypothetical protein ACP6JD_004389 [Aspergillus fumigatus]
MLEHLPTAYPSRSSEIKKLLAKLSPKPQSSPFKPVEDREILTKLSEQQALLEQQNHLLASTSASIEDHVDRDKNSAVKPLTSTLKASHATGNIDNACLAPTNTEMSEVLRLKKELLAANSKLALQEQELAQTRVIKHTLDQALGTPSEADFSGREVTEHTISHLQSVFNAPSSNFTQSHEGWNTHDDSQSDVSEALSTGTYSGARGFWFPQTQQCPAMLSTPCQSCRPLLFSPESFVGSVVQYCIPKQPASASPYDSTVQHVSAANEFTSSGASAVPWTTSPVGANTLQTYISPLEPLNYRRLLDKNVSCDWKYIVDKIICNNDQQASIFLQQKLKVGTAEQKYDIIEAITHQAYPLMVNRFGNFLVQRCFEHGTTEQVVAIANAIKGNTLSLSMDPFGCHVVQKAFDSVPEEHKAVMVHELLCRIPETVIHRYACHVWQKLFELRWSGEPPQIMAKVNEALQGMWHEVALGETGSLVVQNIFENCVEDEKVTVAPVPRS